MNVTVRLYATLRDHAGSADGLVALEVPERTTIGILVARLGLAESLVRLAFVDGLRRDLSYVLGPGDEVAIFPPIAGGG